MQKTKNGIIKCKFCEYKVKKFLKTKQGKLANGYSKLLYHVEVDHPDEFDKLQQQLDEYFTENR